MSDQGVDTLSLMQPEDNFRARSIACLRLFAAEQLRFTCVPPAFAILALFLIGLANKPSHGLIWLALIFITKGIQLLVCRQIIRAELRLDHDPKPFILRLVGTSSLLTLVWLSLFFLVPGTASPLTIAIAAVPGILFTSFIFSIIRCSLRSDGEIQRLMEETEEEIVLPNRLARETIRQLQSRASARQIILRHTSEAGLPHLTGDPVALQNLWMAMAASALNACPYGGTVTIKLSVNASAGIRLSVIGDGYAVGNDSTIFLASRLARRHDAALTIRARDGGGTVLSVDFPAWRTIDTTPVEQRPLMRPTTGQRLLMAVTR